MSLFVPPGHFYSPIYLHEENSDYRFSKEILGIDFNDQVQLDFLKEICSHTVYIPENKIEGFRYFSSNDQFADGDAFFYTGVLASRQPKKIVEIGSGYSSALVLDHIDNSVLENLDDFTLIEPYPDRLLSLLDKELLQFNLIENKVQECNLDLFRQLNDGDILFIDSSHVAKTNSDVLFEIFEIFPRLNKGVLVHIHDIFYPFEYPLNWIHEGRSWNEIYMLRAWLSNNKSVSIKFFADYIYKEHPEIYSNFVPPSIKNHGGGFWFEII